MDAPQLQYTRLDDVVPSDSARLNVCAWAVAASTNSHTAQSSALPILRYSLAASAARRLACCVALLWAAEDPTQRAGRIA